MLYADGALGLAVLCLWVYALLDVVTADETRVRNLPKWAWLLIVLFFGEVLVGPLLWLVAGRPQSSSSRVGGLPYKGNTGQFPEYDRPGRTSAQNPDDDEAFLRGLRQRADEQRRRAEEQRRRAAGHEDDPTS